MPCQWQPRKPLVFQTPAALTNPSPPFTSCVRTHGPGNGVAPTDGLPFHPALLHKYGEKEGNPTRPFRLLCHSPLAMMTQEESSLAEVEKETEHSAHAAITATGRDSMAIGSASGPKGSGASLLVLSREFRMRKALKTASRPSIHHQV